MNPVPWLPLATVMLLIITGLMQALDADVLEFEDNKTHSCKRPCEKGAPPMTCSYYFMFEHYTTLSGACLNCPSNMSDCFSPQCVPGDGRMRGVLSANRQVPGPTIEVCLGDTITVVVDNRMELGEGTSVHWHGLKQKGSPHMDGTNLVTQCPINSQAKMTYNFTAVNPGTHFWHAHSSFQRSDGLFGGLIVRTPYATDPQRDLFDFDLPEHQISIIDWGDRTVGDSFAQDMHGGRRADPTSLLVNGLGSAIDGPVMPHPVFRVKSGSRYRFRVFFNGIMNCPVFVTVDEHSILMIASDGHSFEAVEADAFTIFSGERYDFVLKAGHTGKGNYWMRFKAHGRCKNGVFQTAILRYDGAREENPPTEATYNNTVESSTLRILNGLNNLRSNTSIRVVDLVAGEPDEDVDVLRKKPDKQFHLSIAASKFQDPRFLPVPANSSMDDVRPVSHQFNYISSRLPPSPPLTQFNDLPEKLFCNNDTVDGDCTKTWCTCVHLLRVDLGDIVEIVLVSFTNTLDHPLHLHGHSFRVVATANFNRDLTVHEVKEMDKAGLIERRTAHAPYKDTISVHAQSVVVIRFRANNPGFWFFHCHVEFHSELGMSLILKTGQTNEIPTPPAHFPTCGTWMGEARTRLSTVEEPDNSGISFQTVKMVGVTVGSAVAVVVLGLVVVFVLQKRREQQRTPLYQRVKNDNNEKYQSVM